MPRCVVGELGALPSGTVELGDDERPRAPRDEHRGGVEDVLARRADVRLGDAAPLAEGADERLDRVPGGAALARERGDVVERGVAGGRDAVDLRARAASARSASSIACTQARAETASRSSSGTKIGPKRSELKERRLPLPLQTDVEAQPVAVRSATMVGSSASSPGA